MRLRRVLPSLAIGALSVGVTAVGQPNQGHAAAALAAGTPTMVDPIRGGGEPDISAGQKGNTLITAPGGSGAQTSWFWRTRDDGLSYQTLGPGNGHWVCAGSGGGDSLAVPDPATGDLYVVDQEALADLGLGKLTPSNQLTSSCANAPAVSADRPFFAVLGTGNSTAPQSVADSGKPIAYLSWQCNGCGANTPNGPGGLAYGWTDDGVTYHSADPGAPDNLVQAQFMEANGINSYGWHGNMVVDPTTGNVFTAIGCATSSGNSGCPTGAARNEVGIAVGVPASAPSGNIGQFASLNYYPATGIEDPGTLFPVVGMDSQHTLYLMWTQGDGFGSTTTAPDATSWHIYYSYSLDTAADNHLHKTWSPKIPVDSAPSQAAVFGWMAVGDPGKLGFVWLGSNVREHPSAPTATKQWHPFIATTTNGNTASPTFEQAQVGSNANHLKDVCLQGTVGCITGVGNRNMADFISCDIGPDGALQITYADDANQLATSPATLIPGLPVPMTARQISGPKLIGTGDLSETRFDPTPTTAGITDQIGDALFPLQGGTNQPNLDLTASRVEWDGTNLQVHVSSSNLASLASPDAVQHNVWWLTTWTFQNKIYFAKVQADATGALTYTAGLPKSFDRPGLNGQTVATLVDYSGGTAVTGTHTGNEFVITVPASIVGNPASDAVLESVTGFSVLDNGAPPAIGPGSGNVPTIVDATPAYNAVLKTAPVNAPEAPLVPLVALAGLVIAAVAWQRPRRRDVSST
ncbi:MAG TPA: hypothetical protein VG266_10395 [Candidatus Dormibacteraeota bacterium]|nr:hypothetical protein [Candidatus Dormibacteraeota bacterium]